MFNKTTGSFWKRFIFSKTAGFFLLSFIILDISTACAQNFYYIEAKLGEVAENKATAYSIFLNMQADGITTARIRFTKPSTGEASLVEQSFKDSLIDGKYLLIPNRKANLLGGKDDSAYQSMQIYLEQRTDSLGAYYAPSAINFISADNKPIKAELTVLQEKTYKELGLDKAWVRTFYSENDPFYVNLTRLGTRGGLNAVDLRTTFYFIAIGNTLDTSIGKSVQLDLSRMQGTFSKLTKQLGMRFIPIIVSGVDFNLANTKRVIDSINPKAGLDIIFFYYSGHGFRFKDDLSNYPRISFHTSRLQLNTINNLRIEEVYNTLLAKKARVTIVISDCCNENLGATVPVGIDLLRPRSSGTDGLKINVENFKKLFLPAQRTSILVGAAEKNQLAVCTPSMGGYFTNYFEAQLNKSLYSNNGASSWLPIILNARESTRQKAFEAPKKYIQRAEYRVLPPQ